MKLQNRLNQLVELYEKEDFIKDDPINFVHKLKNKNDIEITGFLASIFAYGKRDLFINVLEQLFSQMSNEPYKFILNCEKNIEKIHNIDYRFSKNVDIQQILLILNKLYKRDKSSLEKLFAYGWEKYGSVADMLQIVCDYFYSNVDEKVVTPGFYHLIPNPVKGSPLKRMNMYLRWMVRKSVVDLGIWDFIPKSELLIPLDVHVARISRQIGLLKRSSNDFKAVLELSNNLKQFDSNDPIKYDFALFGYGVNNPIK